MSVPHRDPASAGGPTLRAPSPVDPPPALAVLALHRDLVVHVQRLARVLAAGDFEALVIWSELAHHGAAGGACEPAATACRPLLLQHLAEATGIPRETVRRKLERLAALGHVERVARGWRVCAGPSAPGFSRLARASELPAPQALAALAAGAPAGVPSCAAQGRGLKAP